MTNSTIYRQFLDMKELTVIQFSKQTGIARSKIYYQIKMNKLKLNNGKINYEDAFQLFNSKELEKHNTVHDIDIKHILNILTLQNLNLQRQLDLAYEREKNYIAELTTYRQHLLLKSALNTPKNESGIQAKPENSLNDRDEDPQKHLQFEWDNQVTLDSCQIITRETNPINEVESHSISTESIHNVMTSPESESGDTGPIKQKNEMTEQNQDALIGTHLPNQDEREQLLDLKRNRKSTAQVATRKSKNNS